MSSKLPLVTVGIPTYNRPEALANTVRALLAQSYPNIEIIVTDDGESARTRAALGDLLARIKYVANPQRLGIYANWNRTVELANGELMAIYHDHDHYDPLIVERSVALFARHAKVGLVHPAVEVISPSGVPTRILHDFAEVTDGRTFAVRQVHTWHSFVAHGAMMVRKRLYDELGKFNPALGFAADMEMLIRFALATDVGYVRQVLYRHHQRRPGDALFEFNWSHVEDTIRTRRSNVGRVFERSPRLPLERARLQVDVDRFLLRQILWATKNGRDDVVRLGEPVLQRQASSVAWSAAAWITSPSGPAVRLRDLAFRVHDRLRAGS